MPVLLTGHVFWRLVPSPVDLSSGDAGDGTLVSRTVSGGRDMVQAGGGGLARLVMIVSPGGIERLSADNGRRSHLVSEIAKLVWPA